MNKQQRNVAIFCDGTGNEYGSKKTNTNVVRLFEMLEIDTGQIAFYDPGVGTSSTRLTRFFQKISMGFKMAFGSDLQSNVEDAYRFLMENYQDGDRIFIFGFSRGAHTARRLACMIETCGLLNMGNKNLLPYAYKVYVDGDAEVQKDFAETFSRPCQPYFVGAWDTVSSIPKLIVQPKLDGVLSKKVKHAYYAVSVREARFMFPPNLWNEDTKQPGQSVDQVWFDGVHSDVGGGYEQDGLSNIPLKWMAKKAQSAGLRLLPGSIEQIEINAAARRHWSWVWHWWIIPFHIYLIITVLVLAASELVLWFSGVEPVQDWRPLGTALDWLAGFGVWTLIAVVLLVIVNRRSRRIPQGARVHRSVEGFFLQQKPWFRPHNLRRVWNSIEWVE